MCVDIVFNCLNEVNELVIAKYVLKSTGIIVVFEY